MAYFARVFERLADSPFPDDLEKFYWKVDDPAAVQVGDPIVLTLYADDRCSVVYYIDTDASTLEITSLYHIDE